MRSERAPWPAVLLLLGIALHAAAEEEIRLFDASGSEVIVRPEGDETLLLHFWATWCPSCVDDLASLGELAGRCGERVRVLAVDAGDGAEVVDAFVRRHAVRLPVLRDPEGDAFRALGGHALPTNLYWTRETRERDAGPKSSEEWEARLAALGCSVGGGEPRVSSP